MIDWDDVRYFLAVAREGSPRTLRFSQGCPYRATDARQVAGLPVLSISDIVFDNPRPCDVDWGGGITHPMLRESLGFD